MILRARKISKSFESPLFTDLDLTLTPGESLAIEGRSGSGKTTLLHILGTLEQPDTGEIWIQDTLVMPSNRAMLRNQSIGFVFQAFHLLEDLTALENVLLPAKIARRKATIEYGLHLLNLVGLVDKTHLPAKLLSGGEKQRVAIARAFCNEPALIIADEPTGNLDQMNSDLVGSLLVDLVEKENKALVVATHDPIFAALCKTRTTLSNGNLYRS
jgi:lipoprotein-releasing system ATP-binding protein